MFTVLYQDRKGGLQVQNRKTKKWYDVPFNKKALVVNTGRALEILRVCKNNLRNLIKEQELLLELPEELMII